MKKILSVLFAVMLCMSLLAGCGSKQKSQSSKKEEGTGKLVFWTPFGGGDFEFMKQMVDEYNATNPKFTVEIISKEWNTHYQGVNSALISNSGPDIFILHNSKIAEMIPTGKLADVSKINGNVDWSTYNQAQIDAVTVDGVQYAVPLDTHAMVMFYNMEILERAGVNKEDLKNVKDIESFNKILEKISQVVESDEHVLDIADSGDNVIQQFWTWYMLYSQAGGKYINNGESTINNEAGVSALNILIDWKDKGYLKPGIEDGASYDLFKSGKAAINFTGVWATGNYETNSDLKFGVIPVPAINGKQIAWGDSHTFAFPSYISEERKEAALAFADYINEHAVTWAKAGHVPVKKSVLNSDEYKAMPYRGDYAEVINFVKYYPTEKQIWPMNDIAQIKINQAFVGDLDSQEALNQAKAEIDDLIKQ